MQKEIHIEMVGKGKDKDKKTLGMDLYSLEVTFESGSQRTEESTGFCLVSWFQCNKSRFLLFHHMFGIVMLFDVFRWMFFLLFLTYAKKSGVEKAV